MPIDIGQNEPKIPVSPPSVQSLSSLAHGFVDRAVYFANLSRDPQDIHEAWRTFRVWLSPWIDYNSDDWRLFLVWYVFHWRAPAPEGVAVEPVCSIAEQYEREFPESILPEEKLIIRAAIDSPMDFYEVYEIQELGCYYVKSLFLGYQHSYSFEELPQGIKVGDVFFGKLIHFMEDRGVIAGHSRPFPPAAKISIAYLRRQLISGRKNEFIKNFFLFDSDLFNLYHDLLNKNAYGL